MRSWLSRLIHQARLRAWRQETCWWRSMVAAARDLTLGDIKARLSRPGATSVLRVYRMIYGGVSRR